MLNLALQVPDWAAGLMLMAFLIIGVLMILVVLIQKPQGGGLSSAFGAGAGSGQTAFGAKTGDMLTWVTVGFFVAFVSGAVLLNFVARADPSQVQPTSQTPGQQTGQPTGEQTGEQGGPAGAGQPAEPGAGEQTGEGQPGEQSGETGEQGGEPETQDPPSQDPPSQDPPNQDPPAEDPQGAGNTGGEEPPPLP